MKERLFNRSTDSVTRPSQCKNKSPKSVGRWNDREKCSSSEWISEINKGHSIGDLGIRRTHQSGRWFIYCCYRSGVSHLQLVLFAGKANELFRDDSAVSITAEHDDALWVEKFAPRAFGDLLSDIVRDKTFIPSPTSFVLLSLGHQSNVVRVVESLAIL